MVRPGPGSWAHVLTIVAGKERFMSVPLSSARVRPCPRSTHKACTLTLDSVTHIHSTAAACCRQLSFPASLTKLQRIPFAFSTLRPFLHLRSLFLLRTSVLTVINPTHRNHHQSTLRHTPGHLPAHTRTAINTIHLNHHRNNNPQGRKTSTRPKGQDWFYHPVRVFLAGGGAPRPEAQPSTHGVA